MSSPSTVVDPSATAAPAAPDTVPRTSSNIVPDTVTDLASLRRGARARIVSVSPERGEKLARRLTDLGLQAGRDIAVGRRAPLGDPTVYRVADYEISLRRRDAALVKVEAFV